VAIGERFSSRDGFSIRKAGVLEGVLKERAKTGICRRQAEAERLAATSPGANRTKQ
jgi:hypothetical protein